MTCLSKVQQGVFKTSAHYKHKINYIDVKDSGSELKKTISSPFPKKWREDATAGSVLPWKGKNSQKKLRGPGSQLREERSCHGAISVVFNTKENLRDLGKQRGLLTEFRIKKRDVSLIFC